MTTLDLPNLKTNLRKLGTSRAVQVPVPLLADAREFTDEIEPTADVTKRIPAQAKPSRDGWFGSYDPVKDKAIWPDVHDVGTVMDWKW